MEKKKSKSAKKEDPTANLTTKEKLLEKALLLFSKQGFEGTSTKEICDAAGANIAAITYHFGTKENLLHEVIQSHFEVRSANADKILKEANTPEEFKIRLKLFLEEAIEFTLQHKEIHQLIHAEAVRNNNKLVSEAQKQIILKGHEIPKRFFLAAQKKGIIRKNVDIELTAHFLFFLMTGVNILRPPVNIFPELDITQTEARDRYIETLINFFSYGILKPED